MKIDVAILGGVGFASYIEEGSAKVVNTPYGDVGVYLVELNGKTIGLSGFDGGPMKDIADACVVVPADSTPHVESFHLALEHLICSCLKQKIEESTG